MAKKKLDDYLKPTPEQLALEEGDVVSHKKYGTGIIEKEWGAYRFCDQCFRSIPIEQPYSDCCGASSKSTQGKGTFDVRFSNDKLHSINCVWLNPLAVILEAA